MGLGPGTEPVQHGYLFVFRSQAHRHRCSFINLPFVRISFCQAESRPPFRTIPSDLSLLPRWQLYDAFDTKISRLTPMLAAAYTEWMDLWAWNYCTFSASSEMSTGILAGVLRLSISHFT